VYTATLGCGSVLTYETPSFAPTQGETVPCRTHGYCVVVRRGKVRVSGSVRRYAARARPRVQRELIEWLESSPVATLPALRRQRFTLRLIAAAERDGLVAVEARSEMVTSVPQ
jgi:hypothetical protein